MARARNIKPGFFKNEDLLECSMAARLLAPGLWMLADREGRLEDRPKRIKLEIFPCDDVDINPLLDELARVKHLIRYVQGEKSYIQITKFTEHQHPHRNEVKSVIPGPYDKLPTKVESTSNQGAKHSGLTTDSLNPSSLNPESSSEDKSSSQEARKPKKKKTEILELAEWEKENGELSLTALRDWIASKGLDPGRVSGELENFKASCRAKVYKYGDFVSAFQKWIGNENFGNGIEKFKLGAQNGTTTARNERQNTGNGGSANTGGGYYRKPTDRERLESSIAEGSARIAAKYGLDLSQEGREGVGDLQISEKGNDVRPAEIR